LIKILADHVFEPGSYTIDWDGRDSAGGSVKGGVYIIRISGINLSQNIKVVCLER
jgi:flagellar hook assembly protein FlgD